MAKMKILAGLELPDMPCKCGNTRFMGDDWPNCSECGKQLPDATMEVLMALYNDWWRETFEVVSNKLCKLPMSGKIKTDIGGFLLWQPK